MRKTGPLRMVVPYDFRQVEDHRRRRGEDAGLHRVDPARVDPGSFFYNLVEFPYPSGEGLHVGHVFQHAGPDAFGRYQRMRGGTVF